jgi:hypothetical protein
MYVGGNWSPQSPLHCQSESPSLSHEGMGLTGNRTHDLRVDRHCQRESPSLSPEEWVWLGIEPTTSEVTGADVNFEHRSNTTAPLWQPLGMLGEVSPKFKTFAAWLETCMMSDEWLWEMSECDFVIEFEVCLIHVIVESNSVPFYAPQKYSFCARDVEQTHWWQ